MDVVTRAVLDRLKALLEARTPLVGLTVFGSRARGEAEADSDLDVLVLVERLDEGIRDQVSLCAWEAGFESGVVVSPIVFSREEWAGGLERRSLLGRAVEAEGVAW